MMRFAKRTIQNEGGFVLSVSILLAAIVLIIGVVSIVTSNTEVAVVRNEGQLLREFYNAEGGVVDAVEHYNSGSTFWLTDDFLTAGPTAAANTVISQNLNGQAVANVEVRCIEETGTSIASLSAAANNLPLQRHVGPPPLHSGYSLRYFEVRRYGVTATSTTGNSQIQVGVWKVFNKF
jgi:hypothetical protein